MELDLAMEEAIERGTPRASSVAWVLQRQRTVEPTRTLAIDALPDHPGVRDATLPNHPLEAYDALANKTR